MNKKLVIGVIAAVVVIAGTTGILVANKDDTSGDGPSMKNSTSNKDSSSKKMGITKACDLFTLAEAKQFMGEATTLGDTTEPAESDDIVVDTCTYTNNATTVPDIRTATIMVRSAKTDDGMDNNNESFETGGAANPAGAVAVDGYAEKAFWDPTLHQLAVLDGNKWIGIVYGSTNVANSTLDDVKKVADLVFN